MTNEMKKVFNNYNEEEQNEIYTTIELLAMCGVALPIKNTEDFKEWCDKQLANKRAKEENERVKAECKAEKERAEAEAKGMTVEELRADKEKNEKIQRYEAEITQMKREIERLQGAINKREKEIKKMR